MTVFSYIAYITFLVTNIVVSKSRMWENSQANSLYGYLSKFTLILEVPGLQVGSSKYFINNLFPPLCCFKNSSSSSLLNHIVGAGSRNILENVEGVREMG
jgi:hypothetical protein